MFTVLIGSTVMTHKLITCLTEEIQPQIMVLAHHWPCLYLQFAFIHLGVQFIEWNHIVILIFIVLLMTLIAVVTQELDTFKTANLSSKHASHILHQSCISKLPHPPDF